MSKKLLLKSLGLGIIIFIGTQILAHGFQLILGDRMLGRELVSYCLFSVLYLLQPVSFLIIGITKILTTAPLYKGEWLTCQ